VVIFVVVEAQAKKYCIVLYERK